MDYGVAWLERSLSDLEAIYDYIAVDNPTAAAKLIRGVRAQAELLRGVPRMGPRYRCRLTGDIRQTVFGNYRIFYQVFEAELRVEIMSVWHGARQEPEL